MKIIDGDNEPLNFDDKKFNEIMQPFDALIDTNLAIKAYDMALKNSSSKKSSDFSDFSSNFDDFNSDCDSTADFGENNSSNIGNSDSNSDVDEETEYLKNAYPIHEMDLETLARILSGKITIEDLLYKVNLKNSESFYNPNNYNPSDFKQNNSSQNSSLKENKNSKNPKKAYFDDVFDFKGSTLFDFEDYLKNTRVPSFEDERKAKKTEKKS